MGPADVLDILLVTSLIYGLLYSLRGTRAVQLLRGLLLVLLVVMVFSRVVPLPTFSAIVSTLLPALVVAVPVVFQPELRRAMERLGRAGRFRHRVVEGTAGSIVSIVAVAARRLAESRHGALIVIERDTGLDDLAERGVRVDALASVDLILQLFYPNSPLHDGAVIVREGRIAAARVVLPLRDAPLSNRQGLGTRHLAAISVTDATDALAVVVSEETGVISLAQGGRLTRYLDEGELSRRLIPLLVTAQPTTAERLLAPFLRVAGGGPNGSVHQGAERNAASPAAGRQDQER
jgi:diadenylate cyclase